ncbi:MAG: aldehyde ferredoxin oxidoreductase N-terminal domain-containing protein [Betaproteobacteria bacterium]
MYGYAGKILRVNLSNGKISSLDTKDYAKWGGGHGMGSAIFWDLCRDKAISGFDPRNVVTIMTSPLSGTLVPAAGGRCEVQGIGVQGYPIEWFTRSNFGGRFAAMLKYAGWDGVVIEGRAPKPVWINIVNDQVEIEDAQWLWGLDTWETQQEIWQAVTGNKDLRDWLEKDGVRTTQRPAVLTIGPAGENLGRSACLIHDAGNAAGQGGFGGVWGSKNLKAISVLGTGNISISNPVALLEARRWFQQKQYNPDSPLRVPNKLPAYGIFSHAPGFLSFAGRTVDEPSRPQGCMSCFVACRRRMASGARNESQCVEFAFLSGSNEQETAALTDLAQKLGINVFEVRHHAYLRDLYKAGLLGPGKQIDCDLPFDKYGTQEFGEAYLKAVAYRKGSFGDALAEGVVRAAKKWGRLEKDTASGALRWAYWGYQDHYDPRVEAEWSYGSVLGDREVNEHDFEMHANRAPAIAQSDGSPLLYSAEKMVEIYAKKLVPYCDPMMLDFSAEGVYSDAMCKTIGWHRRYTRFWKQSLLFCDWFWPDIININSPDFEGSSPEAEPKFYNAVTGDNLTFEQGLEVGRRIWNLDRSIWVLQGRHRDLEVHADYVYNVPIDAPYWISVFENGQWKFSDCLGRVLDKKKFEEWKTKYYKFEGWDADTGWPTRETLEELGLGHVAEELEHHGRLGK